MSLDHATQRRGRIGALGRTEGTGHPGGDARKKRCAKAITDQEAAKTELYAELVSVAKRQVDNHYRKVAPVFKPAVVTSLGEMGPGFIHVQEFLTRIYRLKLLSEGPRMDGLSVQALTAAYRTNFRNRILWCAAPRLANTMRSAGHGQECLRKARTATHG